MKVENLKELEMPLLARKRIKFELEHPNAPTPTKATIKEEIAKKYNTKPELVSVRHIYTKFGIQKAKIIAHIYEDERTLKFLETPKGKKSEPKAAK
ncbi:hypothetical protein HYU23_01445 [Candidatus Woesearchaeota archaeon]|nr:hypothetical protein [Candidatus Woesearchaeota archaeon]